MINLTKPLVRKPAPCFSVDTLTKNLDVFPEVMVFDGEVSCAGGDLLRATQEVRSLVVFKHGGSNSGDKRFWQSNGACNFE